MTNFSKKIVFNLIFLIIIFFLAYKILFYKKPGFAENLAANITYPFLTLSEKISNPIKKYFAKKENLKEIKQNYFIFKEKVFDLIQENIKLKASLKYTEKTKELLEFQKRYNLQDSILVKVLAKNFDESEQFFFVNKGYSSGVTKNMAAIFKTQLIGKVTEVYKHYSKILLITDSKCKISSYTHNTNAAGITVGLNKANKCQMIYVNHLSTVEIGDLVISNGQGLIFPEGFCLGKVIGYETKDFYHKIDIEPLFNFKNLDYCFLTDIEKIEAF